MNTKRDDNALTRVNVSPDPVVTSTDADAVLAGNYSE